MKRNIYIALMLMIFTMGCSSQEANDERIEEILDDIKMPEVIEDAEWVDNDSAHQQYATLITEYESTYGVLEVKSRDDRVNEQLYYASGVMFAKLIDFDGNGVDELVVAKKNKGANYNETYENYDQAERTTTVEVWECRENGLVNIKTDELSEIGQMGDLALMIDETQAIPYYVKQYSSYKLEEHTFVAEKTYEAITQDSPEPVYYLNGAEISNEEFMAESNRLHSNATYYITSATEAQAQQLIDVLNTTKQELGLPISEIEIQKTPIQVSVPTPQSEPVQNSTVVTQESSSYTDEELGNMAIEYFFRQYGARPPSVRVTPSEGNNVQIELYEDLDTHIDSWALYIIDRTTAKGEHMVTFEHIDLNQ